MWWHTFQDNCFGTCRTLVVGGIAWMVCTRLVNYLLLWGKCFQNCSFFYSFTPMSSVWAWQPEWELCCSISTNSGLNSRFKLINKCSMFSSFNICLILGYILVDKVWCILSVISNCRGESTEMWNLLIFYSLHWILEILSKFLMKN